MNVPPDNPLRIVVALGGNAILRAGERGTIEEQIAHAGEVMRTIAALAAMGHSLLITHGNGPVVGNIVLRGEAARDQIPPMPLYISDADSEGGVGLMLQQALHNELSRIGIDKEIATLVTQVVVDGDDPAFSNPTKPIGPFMSRDSAVERASRDGWSVTEFPGRGWRRVVASPLPERIVEIETVRLLADHGTIVIAAGGGGVPVTQSPDGALTGVDAVVDKDWAGSLLACATGADVFAILMESEAIYLDWGSPTQHALGEISSDEARRLLDSGAFEKGTVAPKVAAAAYAVDTCGCTALITGSARLSEAIRGEAGTRIVRHGTSVSARTLR